ncbi:MAG: universal stress protein [Bdellovibrionia bacterium]
MVQFAKIVWAIDPSDDPERLMRSLRMLEYIVQVVHSVIHPVYVVSVAGSSEGKQEVGGRNQSDFSRDRKSTVDLFKDISLKNLRPPRIIQASSNQTHHITDALLNYAVGIRADLLIVNTRGGKGLAQFFRGSFINRLLLRSSIPVLALGPYVTEVRPCDRILYATHLDPVSKSDFRYAVEIASSFRSELTIFHALSRRQRDQDSDSSTAVGEPLPECSHLMRRARAWSKWASKKGVSTDVVFEDISSEITEQILRLAEEQHAGMILLESRSGIFQSFIKSSKVRTIIRRSRCPVLVRRPLKKESLSQVSHGKEQKAA